MATQDRLSGAGQAYVAGVAAAGITAILHSIHVLYTNPVGYQWAVLAGLTLLSGSFTIRIPSISARLSVSETFVFAAVLLFGPAAATMIVVLDTLVISLWRRSVSRRPSRLLFNVAAPAIAIWVASHAFYSIAGIEPLYLESRPILSLVVPLLVLAILYFLLNSWLIAGAVAFEKQIPVFEVWRQNFLWLSLNYFSGASVALLLLPYLLSEQYAFVRVAAILLPLLLISYLTFKTALGRVDDANRHLSELNKLYLSTIETLAMAIDAKDQITHGHIRRVQQYAVGLARHLGVKDAIQISAIEAASLLHDMGKLAVPEYILNKPGKLTPAEFEKMKLHASVGADILSAIDFPYPVVPIVRHHHECWDGTGYPDGIKGSAIPMGARILSVVDCFDALTSDRPYRPRLSDADAIRILTDRRGSMYDPLVVDAFIRVYRDIAPPQVEDRGQASGGLSVITQAVVDPSTAGEAPSRLDDISASTEEMLVLYDLAKNLTGQFGLADAGDVIYKHLRRIVPASTCVFYVYDSAADELVAAHAAGESAAHFVGLRIPRGQRLTGWIAANKQTILNSDPVLDLGEVARSLQPRLRSCLGTHLTVDSSLVGVITLYSTHRDAFNEDHRRIVEAVARQVAQTVKHALEAQTDRAASRDQLTGLPNLQHLERFISSEAAAADEPGFSIILISLTFSAGFGRQFGRSEVDQTLAAVAEVTRRTLRGADVLFRYGSEELVVLLMRTDADAAKVAAGRISERIRGGGGTGDGKEEQPMAVVLGIATAPDDGKALEGLISAARHRVVGAPASQRPPSIH